MMSTGELATVWKLVFRSSFRRGFFEVASFQINLRSAKFEAEHTSVRLD